jgi:large-conductance mechanosensitive channel
MTEKDKRFITSWEKQRQKGKWPFALRVGILWALVTYALMQVFYFVFQEGYVFEIGRFLTGLAVFIIMGFLVFGLLMWRWNEKAYQQIKAKNPEA